MRSWTSPTRRVNKLIRPGDVAALIAVLALAAVLAPVLSGFFSGGAAVVEVYKDGRLVRTALLAEDAEFTVSGDYENVITISGGRVRVSHSDCPGGDCVRSGEISEAGRSIFCLPNGVEVRLSGGEPEVDAIAG